MKLLLILLCSAFMASCDAAIRVEVANPSAIARKGETVEISWDQITKKLPQANTNNIVVMNQGVQIPSQVTRNALIFQVDIPTGGSQTYLIECGTRENYKAKTYGRLIPERKDDWAWENDKMAWRVYGPALQATGEVSNGIDVWCKRTEELVINDWYKGNDYHTDKGEGMDGYKVGRTLGAGALAPILNDSLSLGLNFTKAELLDSGAIRTSVRLSYAPYKVGNDMITEERIISLDAGSRFNKVTSTFSGISNGSMPVVAGFPLRPTSVISKLSGGVALGEAADANHGTTFLAIVMQSVAKIDTLQNHIAVHSTVRESEPMSYLIGGAWSLADVPSHEEWQKIVEQRIAIEKEPLTITIK